MKNETKKLVVTVINICIFIGNAILSYLGNGGDFSTLSNLTVGVIAGVAIA